MNNNEISSKFKKGSLKDDVDYMMILAIKME